MAFIALPLFVCKMEMESDELLYDEPNPEEEEEVDHDLAGVDVDGLLGDDDQSMAGQSDVESATVTAETESEEVLDTNYVEEAICAEEEYQEDAENEDVKDNAEESMDQEQQDPDQTIEDNEVTRSNVCCFNYYLKLNHI